MDNIVIPPLRFAIVENQLYRGSYPRPLNLGFLASLRLRTILSLTADPLTPTIADFCRQHGINMVHLKLEPTKKGAPLRPGDALSAVQIMTDASHAPLYVHCLNGSEITGLAVATLRKIQFWDSSAIISELMRFSDHHSSFDLFLEGLIGEYNVPRNVTPWLWQGIKDEDGMGPVRHRVSVKYLDAKLEELRQKKLQLLDNEVNETNGHSVSFVT